MINLVPCIKVLVLSLIVFLNFYTSLYAELQITKILQNDGLFDVVLNDDIEVSNISLRNNDIEFPVYKGKNKIYRQFFVLKREFRQYMVNSLSKNKIAPKKIIDTSFKVNKLSILKNHKTIKAFASVIFNNDIEVECRIMNGRKGLWVVWPSNKKNDIWIKDFRFINKNLKQAVEKKLITDYTLRSHMK
jgi:DNA-binding cell septation regulator SpoVG